MLSRLERENAGTPLPQVWLEEGLGLLNQTFNSELEKNNLQMQLFGETYPDEVCLALGIFSKHEKAQNIWTTLMLSTSFSNDLKVEKSLENLLNALGPLIDIYFANKDELDFVPTWQEEVYSNSTVFYKISHENLILSYEADKWLK